jgi:transcription elongation GreA/GreB family factor
MTKSGIIAEAVTKLSVRITEVVQQIAQTEESQAEDSKSSAGDKFETGRERLQQELNRLGAQLVYLQEQRTALEYIGRDKKSSTKATVGSLVSLANGARYLIAVGFGKLKLSDGTSVFVVSPEAPIGQALIGKAAGASFAFRGNVFAVSFVE